MRISEIKVEQKSNLGNYESITFSAAADLKEDENINDATTKLFGYVDWHVKKPTRDGQARTYKLILADANAPADKKSEAEKWLAKYEERRAIVEAM